jgi:hypothetical protein
MKERVILIERGSEICDNMGLAYVDYANLKRGKYRLYFMRIENEQRIMFNSRLEVLGASNSFTLNNVIEEGMERKSNSPAVRDARNGGVVIRINGNSGSMISNHEQNQYFDDSSELDSFALLNQMANRDSFSNSIYSSD